MLYIIILRWRWALCMIYPYLFHRWHCSLYVRPGSRCKGGGQVSPQAQVHSGWGWARLWGFRCCWCPRWLSLCVGWLGQLSPLLVRSNRTLEFTFWVNNDDRFDSFYGSPRSHQSFVFLHYPCVCPAMKRLCRSQTCYNRDMAVWFEYIFKLLL